MLSVEDCRPFSCSIIRADQTLKDGSSGRYFSVGLANITQSMTILDKYGYRGIANNVVQISNTIFILLGGENPDILHHKDRHCQFVAEEDAPGIMNGRS